MRMVDVLANESRIRISPDLEIPTCKLSRHQRVELKGGSQSSSHLLEVFDFENR